MRIFTFMRQTLTPEQLAALDNMPLGERPNRLALAITIAGVKQGDVVEATGLTQPYISAVTNGRYQTITVENARKFADFFGAPIEVLFPSRDTENEARQEQGRASA